jgi:preprotein translocase subunit YajC
VNRIRRLSPGLIVVLLIALVSLGSCLPQEAPAEGTAGFDWTLIIFLVAIFALMYFVLIRPQRKRQKEHQKLVEELRRGDKVITSGGVYGVIESTSEDSVVIKVESGTLLRVARSSVALKRDS